MRLVAVVVLGQPTFLVNIVRSSSGPRCWRILVSCLSRHRFQSAKDDHPSIVPMISMDTSESIIARSWSGKCGFTVAKTPVKQIGSVPPRLWVRAGVLVEHGLVSKEHQSVEPDFPAIHPLSKQLRSLTRTFASPLGVAPPALELFSRSHYTGLGR